MAEAVETVTLSGILNFFNEDQKIVEKGEQKFKCGFVLDVKLREHTINAMIRTSTKDKSYTVCLEVNGDGNILRGTCDCPREKWIRSHMAAAAIHANKNGFSKTDLPNTWIKRPKTEAKKDVKTMDFFTSKKPRYQAPPRAVSEQDRLFLFEKLSNAPSHCPMKWIISPQPVLPASKVLDNIRPALIEDILVDFITDKQVFINKCKVSAEQISWLAEETKEQRNCETWGRYRRLHLTGSNFGDELGAIARHLTSI